ncbi:MAG: prepilin-type N-terminal cleavage/methylation domain-containing protein [bacterium]|nr:prepilin-type N-terminal cleavage/methylation domain-containing protein [bacterium]
MSRVQLHEIEHRRGAGFTLIELMLVVTMLSVVMYLTLDSLRSQKTTSIVTEQIVEVQNNVRAVSSLLEREIRMAGFMVPAAVSVCGVDRTDAPDELFLSEVEMIVPDDERAGTLGARLSALNSWAAGTVPPPASPLLPIGGGTEVTLALDATTTDLDDDGSYFYDNDDSGTPESDFRDDGGFILADMANPGRGTVCGTVKESSSTSITLRVRAGQLTAHSATSDAPEEVVIVPAAHYWVSDVATGRLQRNSDLLVKDVDDFQISYFFDDDGDGVIDNASAPPPAPPDEERGDLATRLYDPADQDNSSLAEVRFSIVLRAASNDPDYDDGEFIEFENRADVLGNDNFRRRVLIGAVRPRNVVNDGSI